MANTEFVEAARDGRKLCGTDKHPTVRPSHLGAAHAARRALQVSPEPQEQLTIENTRPPVTKMAATDEDHTGAVSDVITWMIGELEKNGRLSQICAAVAIKRRFGDEFVNRKKNGKLAISREVNALFRRQTLECIVWVRRHRMWRWRRSSDKPGRQQ